MASRSKLSSIRETAWAAVILALAAVALTVYVAIAEAPLPGDVRLTREVQSWDWFSLPAEVVNGAHAWVQVPWMVVVATMTVRFIRDGKIGLETAAGRGRGFANVAVTLALTLAIGPFHNLLKQLVDSPRPTAEFGVTVSEFQDSNGFPSGHVYQDVLLLGAVALVAPLVFPRSWVRPVQALMVVVIVLSGPARVFVGAHWPSDTVGGYLWGAAGLCGAVAFTKWLFDRYQKSETAKGEALPASQP